MALSSMSVKRRESVSQWFKQLLIGQEQAGTAKAAAAAWLGTIYALRAASRMDANKEWGRIGDDMIGSLEQAYLDHMGKDGAQAVEMGRRMLRTDEHPEMPKPVAVPRSAVRPMIRPTMPKLPHLKSLPHIKTPLESRGARKSGNNKPKAKARAKAGGGKKAKRR